MPGKRKVPSSKRKPRERKWQHELDVVGLQFRWKRSGRRALSDMLDTRGSIGGIRLVREPDNPVDPNAIAVYLPSRILDGKQLGYLRRETAALLAPRIDANTMRVASCTLEWLRETEDWNSGQMIAYFLDVVPKRGTKVR